MKPYLLKLTDDIFDADNGFAGELIESCRSQSFIVDDNFVLNLSPQLTFSRPTPTPETAPPLFSIGKNAACRKIYGDEWANNIHITQDIPVKGLPNVTADGYFYALENGYHMDLIEFKTKAARGAYSRVIIANKTAKDRGVAFFSTYQFVHDFEKTR